MKFLKNLRLFKFEDIITMVSRSGGGATPPSVMALLKYLPYIPSYILFTQTSLVASVSIRRKVYNNDTNNVLAVNIIPQQQVACKTMFFNRTGPGDDHCIYGKVAMAGVTFASHSEFPTAASHFVIFTF